MLRQAERIRLGDPHHPDLAGPWIEVTEDLLMEEAEMSEIVVAGQGPGAEVRQRRRRQARFDRAEAYGIGDSESVAEYAGLRSTYGSMFTTLRTAPGPARACAGC
ncbi:hypothetical protein GCM10010140_48350 [Streptosporangium pseudovulgare]|uniref:Uncharacterized protein n=1 Tax=Streptosporangium pseudovulgare TaxID=35765 RepID=A0ABQ2R6B3_9ACTN|nr:hypothetical protein GCM10010140_48350 [Streptosporangium pseudovulgare]